MTRVVSGVAISNGLVLMGKRKIGKLRPQLWELPGGKIEAGESPRDALIREWREEFGVELLAVSLTKISTFTFELETTFEVELYQVTPSNIAAAGWQWNDHDALAWVHPLKAVQHMPCSPGLYVHYADLRQYMKATEQWIDP